MNSFDLEGVKRLAARFLYVNRPETRGQAMDLVVERYGAYDLDRDSLSAGVDAYFRNESCHR